MPRSSISLWISRLWICIFQHRKNPRHHLSTHLIYHSLLLTLSIAGVLSSHTHLGPSPTSSKEPCETPFNPSLRAQLQQTDPQWRSVFPQRVHFLSPALRLSLSAGIICCPLPAILTLHYTLPHSPLHTHQLLTRLIYSPRPHFPAPRASHPARTAARIPTCNTCPSHL